MRQDQHLVRSAISSLVFCLLVFCTIAAPLPASQPTANDRESIDAEFRERINALAAKCDELGIPEQARITREWIVQRDPGRQYLFVIDDDVNSTIPGNASELVKKWFAKFMEHRRAYAAQLFDIAKRRSELGRSTSTYQLLHEVLHHDPSHTAARRILNATLNDDDRPHSRSMRLAHSQFGWQRGRWWQIDSRHFQIVTDLSSEAGIELARQLEDFHTVWQQLFFEYWTTREWLNEHFAGKSPHIPPEPKHKVVLFRDRQEYVDRLVQAEPKIALTLGYYMKGNRTSYFHAGDDTLLSVWYHEATHQLFQENGEPLAEVGDKWNFWIVEGVAVYMESLVKRDQYYTVGGFDADRLQFARSRVLSGEPQMPLEQFVSLGREDLQKHPEIRKLYTQAAGLTHFLMDFDHGRYRDSLTRFLISVYLGKDSPRLLLSIRGLSSPEFDADWKAFLTVHDSELRFLGPPPRRRNLSLLKGDVTDKSLEMLVDSPRLEWLDLSLTSITAQGLVPLRQLNSLQRLSLVGTKIDDSAATTLASFPKLEELDLSDTGVTDNVLTTLATLPKIKVLRLARTAVTNSGVAKLGSCKQLEELDVEGTAVTEEALTLLRKQLPHLK